MSGSHPDAIDETMLGGIAPRGKQEERRRRIESAGKERTEAAAPHESTGGNCPPEVSNKNARKNLLTGGATRSGGRKEIEKRPLVESDRREAKPPMPEPNREKAKGQTVIFLPA